MVLKGTFELGIPELDAWIMRIEASTAHGRGSRRGDCAPLRCVIPGLLAEYPGMLDWLKSERWRQVELAELSQSPEDWLSRNQARFPTTEPLPESDRLALMETIRTVVASGGQTIRERIRLWYRAKRREIPPGSSGSPFLDAVKAAWGDGISAPRHEQGSLFAGVN